MAGNTDRVRLAEGLFLVAIILLSLCEVASRLCLVCLTFWQFDVSIAPLVNSSHLTRRRRLK